MKTISYETLAKLAFSGGDKCEEANLYGIMIPGKFGPEPAPCSRPATKLMASEKDGRIYPMCDMCADHNTRRGMVIITPEQAAIAKAENK